MDHVKISQWDALLMESLRGLGWSDDELLRRVGQRDLPKDDSKYEFDYQELADFAAKEPDLFEAAVQQGYSIKYNTIRGLRSWIAIAFGIEPEMVLEEGREAVKAVLTSSQKDKLASALSFGWRIDGEHQAQNAEPSLYTIQPLRS
jgi:hypothetical protein